MNSVYVLRLVKNMWGKLMSSADGLTYGSFFNTQRIALCTRLKEESYVLHTARAAITATMAYVASFFQFRETYFTFAVSTSQYVFA
jgi:hypothetical protein